jgi:hypothetical protein
MMATTMRPAATMKVELSILSPSFIVASAFFILSAVAWGVVLTGSKLNG